MPPLLLISLQGSTPADAKQVVNMEGVESEAEEPLTLPRVGVCIRCGAKGEEGMILELAEVKVFT